MPRTCREGNKSSRGSVRARSEPGLKMICWQPAPPGCGPSGHYQGPMSRPHPDPSPVAAAPRSLAQARLRTLESPNSCPLFPAHLPRSHWGARQKQQVKGMPYFPSLHEDDMCTYIFKLANIGNPLDFFFIIVLSRMFLFA